MRCMSLQAEGTMVPLGLCINAIHTSTPDWRGESSKCRLAQLVLAACWQSLWNLVLTAELQYKSMVNDGGVCHARVQGSLGLLSTPVTQLCLQESR